MIRRSRNTTVLIPENSSWKLSRASTSQNSGSERSHGTTLSQQWRATSTQPSLVVWAPTDELKRITLSGTFGRCAPMILIEGIHSGWQSSEDSFDRGGSGQ